LTRPYRFGEIEYVEKTLPTVDIYS
jgi:hypothetical protein